MDEYTREFVQESEENITQLNNSLLELERAPNDRESMDEIFRMAHTLKGNCGAMGYDGASDLAHAIEDRLDDIRAGRLDVTADLMDEIFDAVDELEAMVDEVRNYGAPEHDPTETIDHLHSLAPEDVLTPPSDSEIDAAVEAADVPEDDHNVYHVRLDVEPAESVNNGRRVVEALIDAFDLLETLPDRDSIDSGDYDGEVDAVFGTAVTEEAISNALEPVDAVGDFVIVDVTDRVETETVPDTSDQTAAAAAPGADEIGPADDAVDDMSVDELLGEFEDYDDLDEMVEHVEDAEGLEELGDHGTFDGVEVELDVDAPDPLAEAEDGGMQTAPDASNETASAERAKGTTTEEDRAESEPSEEEAVVGDASETFKELQEEVDSVGFDELQNELQDLEFDQYDQEEEVGFDELLSEEELEEEEFDPFGSSLKEEAETADKAAASASEPAIDQAEATSEAQIEEVDPETLIEEETEAESPHDEAETAADVAEPEETVADSGTAMDFETGEVEGEEEPGDASSPEEESVGTGDAFADDLFGGSEPAEGQTADEPEMADAPEEPEMAEAPDEPASVEATEEPESVEGPDEPEAAEATEEPESVEGPEAPETAEAAEAPESVEGPDVPEPAEATEEPESVEGPEAPETAVATGEPESVEGPEAPETAEATDEPESVEGPDVPETAEVTDEPESVEGPEAPETAEATNEPESVEGPEAPETAEATNEPESVEGPEAPETAEATNEPESVEGPEAPETAEATDEPESVEGPDVPETAEATEEPERAEATEEPESVEGPEAPETAEATDEPESVEGPDVPETAEATEEPESVEGPEAPETAEATDEPESVEGPEAPETAETTEEPESVEGPDVPETPEATEEPESVEGPEAPETAETTEEPESVEGPDVPETPEATEEPERAEEAQSTEGVETASESTEFEPDVDIDTGEEVAFDQGYDEFEEMSASGTIPESSSPSAESESPSIADRESSTTPDVESDLGDAADFSPDVDVEPTADVSGSISPEEPEELDEIQSGSEPPLDEAAETALPSEETGAAEPSQAGQETGAVEIPDETAFEERVETDLESADFDSVDATVEFGPKESTTEPVSDQQSVTDAQSAESGDSAEELGGVEVGEFDLDDQEDASGDEIATDDLSAEIEQADEAFADLDLEDSSSEPDFDGLDRDFGAGSGAGIRSDSEAPSPAEEATPDQAAPGLPIEVSSESEDLPDRDVDLTDLVPTPPEEMVAADGEDSDEPQSVRIEIDRVDDLLNLVEGLVTTRARLRRAVESGESLAAIDQEIDDLEDLVGDLQDTVMDVRLVPLSTAANRLPRTVRDIAREQNKEVAFEMEGGDVEIDRSILDDIDDPLMHLVRNAVDHGIEPPEEREATDKDPEGTVRLSARRRRDRVVIEVEDDGRGLDPNRLRNEAVEQGMLTRDEAESLSDEESYDLVFESGFSTNQDVTDVSGRGVGMDVVSTTVEDLDGAVTVESERGEGTTVRMTLPVSVAISDVLFVRSGEEEFGVPLKAVEEIGGMGRVDTEDGQEGLVDGDERYPLVRLADTLETRGVTRNGDGMTVKLRKDVRQIAIHCDEVRGQQEVVVRPFEGVLGDIPGLSGATVLGEGDVVNILDVNTL